MCVCVCVCDLPQVDVTNLFFLVDKPIILHNLSLFGQPDKEYKFSICEYFKVHTLEVTVASIELVTSKRTYSFICLLSGGH